MKARARNSRTIQLLRRPILEICREKERVKKNKRESQRDREREREGVLKNGETRQNHGRPSSVALSVFYLIPVSSLSLYLFRSVHSIVILLFRVCVCVLVSSTECRCRARATFFRWPSESRDGRVPKLDAYCSACGWSVVFCISSFGSRYSVLIPPLPTPRVVPGG